jgi:hypothetical protein
MGLALNVVHTLTSFHGVGGMGLFHRKSPTGGEANGIPLKTFILPSSVSIPDTFPNWVSAMGLNCPYVKVTIRIEKIALTRAFIVKNW